MKSITSILEEAPGVRSIARWVALMLTILTGVIVVTCCVIAVYAIVHAKDHEGHAAAAVGSAGSLISMLTLLLAPVIGGIWIALGLRKRSPDEPTLTTTRVEMTGPAAAQPSVAVTPAATGGP